ncbi:tetratricopeptide repeat protein [Tamlana flava]|uniref:tetratricopeptide repeat protein n=1 Tax=Tamlana flava TaxID=3158572 RepID=UPI00351AFA09
MILSRQILTILLLLSTLGCKKAYDPNPELITIDLERGDFILCSAGRFGDVDFLTSCSENTRETFNLAISLLHSFEYVEAEKAFVKVIDADPSCSMAYWGVAMSIYHSLWMQSDKSYLQKGVKLLEIANKFQLSEKEKDYLDAICVFYMDWETVKPETRKNLYEKKMETLYHKYRNDAETAIFYALALRAAANPNDKTYAKQKKSGKILEDLFEKYPNHPGIAHYIIHNYDYPELAYKALNTARRYAQIAPASAHAQHMPSHIFTRLGLWEESIKSNINSTESARCYSESINPSGHWDEELHGMDYLVYAYLQIGDNSKAKEQYDYLKTFDLVFPANFKVAYSSAAIPTRIAIENKNWLEASTLQLPKSNIDWGSFPWQTAILHFGKILGLVHIGSISDAENELEILKGLHQELADQNDNYKANQVLIQINSAEAWIKFAKGNRKEALVYMLKASELESNTSKHAVTPCEVLPADELLGDLYLQLNEPTQALKAYEFSLKNHPNRFNSIYGAATAAKLLGHENKSKHYFESLVKLTKNAGCDRPELNEAKKNLNLI